MKDFLPVFCNNKKMLINIKNIVVVLQHENGCEIIVSAIKNNENLSYLIKDTYDSVVETIDFLLQQAFDKIWMQRFAICIKRQEYVQVYRIVPGNDNLTKKQIF